MSLCTLAEVAQFLSITGTAKLTLHTDNLNRLITDMSDFMEDYCNRWFTKQTITDKTFDKRQLVLDEDVMYLPGRYRDVISISSLTENGTTLTSGTNFIVLPEEGKLVRASGIWWNPQDINAYVMSGVFGYYDQTTDLVKNSVKELCIGLVAVNSGLWYKNYTEGSVISGSFQVTKLPKLLENRLSTLRNISI